MKLLKQLKWDTLLMGVLYILLGIVALVIPETMERLLGFLIGAVLIIAGAVSMISYLLRDAHQNYYHNDFLHGLLGILLGIVVLYKVDIIISLVPFLLGTLVLVSGLSKLQDVIDLKRLEYGNWIFMLVLAIINIALGLVLIFNPMAIANLLFRLLGVGLIFSGITDCATTIYFAGKIRNYFAEMNAIDSTFVEISNEEKGGRAKAKAGNEASKAGAGRAESTASKTGAGAGRAESTASKAGAGAGRSEDTVSKTGAGAGRAESTASKAGAGAGRSEDTVSKTGAGAGKAEDTASKAGADAGRSEDTVSKTGAGAGKAEDTASKAGAGEDKAENTASNPEA